MTILFPLQECHGSRPSLVATETHWPFFIDAVVVSSRVAHRELRN